MIAQIHESPVGPLTLSAHQGKVVGCAFDPRPLVAPQGSPSLAANRPAAQRRAAPGGALGASAKAAPADLAVLDDARRQLDQFFAGARTTFSLPLVPPGTEFQRRVWQALREIPYGRTVSYGNIAAAIGAPTASRAVGAANGRNPICILIPCHRVVGADGSLTGFGGGLERKRVLLALESGQLSLGPSQARVVSEGESVRAREARR